ncbi:zinc finger protein 82-like isoform X2, partial [Leptotrombidium deliense]
EDASVTMCNACGRGPYNSYYHFLEHKRQFCRALKGRKPLETFQTTVAENSAFIGTKAIKSITQRRPNIAKKSMVTLEPTPRQTARKSMNPVSVQIDRGEPKLNQVLTEDDDDGFADDFSVEPQDQIVKCSTCGDEIENIEKFALHKLKHISHEIFESASADPLKCEICNAKISHYQRMQQHLILHLQNFTVIRQKNLTEIRRKKQMNDDDSDDDEPLLTCPYCKANFVSRISLADHIRNACPSRYQCPKCQRTYLTKESLVEHKEQCIRNAALRSNSQRPAFKCRTCGLEFKVKQQLLWHEHACSKVYGADLAGRVEEIIQRTLTCGVCGMVSKDYENKLKHERRCLQRYLSDVGFRPLGVEEDTFSDVEPYEASSCDVSTVKSLSEKLDEETIKMLKEKYGIFKDPKILLRAEDITNFYEKSEADISEEENLKKLKKSFENLLLVLLGDDVYKEVVREDSADAVLNRMLNDLGEAPIAANGLSELTCFSQNLQTFLKLSIKEETLEKANHTAQSVEEVIVNLLTFPYELK